MCSKPLNREILRIIRPRRDLSEVRKESDDGFELDSPKNHKPPHPKLGMTSILRRRSGMDPFEEKLTSIWKMPTRHLSMSKLDSLETLSPQNPPQDSAKLKRKMTGTSNTQSGVSDQGRDVGVILTEGPQQAFAPHNHRVETDPGSTFSGSERLNMGASLVSNTSQLPLMMSPTAVEKKEPTSVASNIQKEKSIIKRGKK